MTLLRRASPICALEAATSLVTGSAQKRRQHGSGGILASANVSEKSYAARAGPVAELLLADSTWLYCHGGSDDMSG